MVTFLVLFSSAILMFPILFTWVEAWKGRHHLPPAYETVEPLLIEEEWFGVAGFFALLGAAFLTFGFDWPMWVGFPLVFVVWVAELFALAGISSLGLNLIRLLSRWGSRA